MSSNFLRLNVHKTEVLLVGSRAQLSKFNLPSLKIAGTGVFIQTNPVRNLGVMLDSGMTMSAKVSSIVKSANFHLDNTDRVRKLLTVETTELYTLVTSRLDYCNSLLTSINKNLEKGFIMFKRQLRD